MPDVSLSPAERAAEEVRVKIQACIDQGKSFLLEAGAGAGKTHSLIQALHYLIEKRGAEFLRQHQQVACITYTNVAVNEIITRTDRHPAICASTIHAFCWTMIKDFQTYLRKELPSIHEWWGEKLQEAGGIGKRTVGYDELGFRTVDETHVSLHHNDVLALTVKLMAQSKFRRVLVSRFPVLFIDEYQDTDKTIAAALKSHFLDTGEGPLFGFFGDHWQKIYGTGCGKIEHHNLAKIDKGANFRSVPAIVTCLNRIRAELPQEVKDPAAEGFVAVYHTNDWVGVRVTGQHWAGDLPPAVANAHLDHLVEFLEKQGWDFLPEKTKILMLTHKVLAAKQGYDGIASIFPYSEAFIKKEDSHIAFLVDDVEPVCIAYEKRRFGEMFAALRGRMPAILSRADKAAWKEDMDKLLELRGTGSIGAVLVPFQETFFRFFAA